MNSLIVTLDGPAGSGKSTVARQLAQRLGLDFLDSGAMYRGIAVLCIESNIDPTSEPDAVGKLAQACELQFDWKCDPPRLYANNKDVTDRLRDADVAEIVSPLAAIGSVRQVLVSAQQEIGRQHPQLVTEGRDQGSVVFPNAAVKFYLDASPQVRAKRRVAQIRDSGRPADEESILKQLMERDVRDSSRKDGPLVQAADAQAIDTSDLTLVQVIDLLENRVREVAKLEEGKASWPSR